MLLDLSPKNATLVFGLKMLIFGSKSDILRNEGKDQFLLVLIQKREQLDEVGFRERLVISLGQMLLPTSTS